MQYKPHKYQQKAIEFLKMHPIAAIFLDMGMGKTSLTIQAIHDLIFYEYEVSHVLIIAPLRVAKHTWPDELRKWDQFKDLTFAVAVGTPKERIKALEAGADITIINRENIPWLIEKSGMPFNYEMIVIDELSSFKAYSAQRFKALMKVRPKVERICGLTGTPSSSGLGDLFSQYKLLDMGERLGRFITHFRNQYFKPDRVNGPIVYSYKLLPGAEEAIYDKISDITMSMKAEDYLDLPEMISTEYPVYLSDAEMETYKNMKKELICSLGDSEITAQNAASLSGKLCQFASGAVYTEDNEVLEIHTKKLDALEEIVEAALGKPLLVVYWFKHDLTRISERLDKMGVNYKKLDSDESIDEWCNKKLEVGLIHSQSAGHGLNLQSGGSTMVFFSLTWSLELYLQTTHRLYRQGQTEAVKIIHIIAANTIDEQIMKALQSKEMTHTALIDAVKASFE